MTLWTDQPAYSFNRVPSAVDKFAAALESVRGGVGINPAAQKQKYNVILSDIVNSNDLTNPLDFNRTKPPRMDAGAFLQGYLNTQPQQANVAWGERIPVGEDPIFPMSQEEFREYVLQRLDEKYGPRKVAPRGGGGPSLFPVRGV